MNNQISLTVNGTKHNLEPIAGETLSSLLRERLRLTGTKIGCEEAECGACTVLVDGAAVKSCTMLAVQADGASITTIEGIAADGDLHPIQAAFREKHGLQCGFCTPGMIMCAVDLLSHDPDPSEQTIRRAIDGNICRCTGYQNIVAAVREAASTMASAPTAG